MKFGCAQIIKENKMDIRQGKEILIKGTVTGVMTALNSGEKYHVKIGDQVIWITPNDVDSVKEDE